MATTTAGTGSGFTQTTPYTGPVPVPNQLAGVANPSWQEVFLNDLGVPISQTNIAAVTLWADSEGVQSSNNFLAASGQGPGATHCIAQCGSSSPIFAYATAAEGAAFDAAFIRNNNYSGVINAFVQAVDTPQGQPNPASLAIIYNAINISGWCKGCQGGQYPVQLYQSLGKNAAQILSSVAGSVTPLATNQQIAGAVGGAVKDVAGAAGSAFGIAGLGTLIGDLISGKFWERILLFAGGLLLVIFGSVIFFQTTNTGKTITSEAGQAAAVAAVA